jgi:hypothetical protein
MSCTACALLMHTKVEAEGDRLAASWIDDLMGKLVPTAQSEAVALAFLGKKSRKFSIHA